MDDKHIPVRPAIILFGPLLTVVSIVRCVDLAAAMTFYRVASFQGVTLDNRTLKVAGARTRAHFLRPHTLPPLLYEEECVHQKHRGLRRLKRDFDELGDIELVEFLKEE